MFKEFGDCGKRLGFHIFPDRLFFFFLSAKMINFAYGAKTQHGRLTYFLGFVYVARFQAFRINSKRLILLSEIDGCFFLV